MPHDVHRREGLLNESEFLQVWEALERSVNATSVDDIAEVQDLEDAALAVMRRAAARSGLVRSISELQP